MTEKLPDDPLLHVCLMTYVSDLTLLETVLLEHGVSWLDGTTAGASLDHAMWFHRPFRADQWLLYAQETPIAAGGRGLARGEVFTAEGELVVSVVQEGLIRIIRPATEPHADLGARNLSLPRTKSQVKNVLPCREAFRRLSVMSVGTEQPTPWKEVPTVDELHD